MPIPVISVEKMREWENATWSAGVSQADVIRRAGGAVARYAELMTNDGDAILVIAGKGHNGDDACQAGAQLKNRHIDVIRILDPQTAEDQIASAIRYNYKLIIDGIFGIGLNRALDEQWVRIIKTVNRFKSPILAVDVPSGLNAQTGESMGEVVNATATVTLGAPKIGMFKVTAQKHIGRLYVAPDIGLIPYELKSDIYWTIDSDFEGYPPVRNVTGHKGTYGHLTIIGGSLGYHGAAVLAARGAQRAQPGLITLFTSPEVYNPIASQLASVMVHPFDVDLALPGNTTAVVAGMGLASKKLSQEMIKFVIKLWEEFPSPVCIDASALDWLPKGNIKTSAARVTTPHPGEAARMLGVSTTEVLEDRVTALRKLSELYGGCWVVLKGHQTLIGKCDSPVYINSTGNPYLAQGGAGDILAGFIGGLIAQPILQKDILTTLRYAVWKHGQAADRLQEISPGWTIEELTNMLCE